MKFMLPRRLLSICLITGMCVMLTSCGGAHGKAKISEAKGKITKETVTKEISMQKPEENDNKEKQKILNISDIKEVPQGLSDDICQVLEYYVYGTRYNFKASLNLKKTNDLSDIKEKDIKNIAFVLVDGIEDPGNVAIKKKAKYTYNKGKIFITFSKKINQKTGFFNQKI